MDSVSIELWLDKRQLAALEQALTEDGTTVERTMQEQLNELYAQRVPLEQQEKIQQALDAERLESQRNAEASARYAGLHITENGQEHYLSTKSGQEFLDMAILMRRYVRGTFGDKEKGFARCIYGAEEISPQRFEQLAAWRLENFGKVTGLVEIDFDKGLLSALNIMDGWQSFRLKDVSSAAYFADKSGHVNKEVRWNIFLSRLEGKRALRAKVTQDIYAQRCQQARAVAEQALIAQLGTQVTGPLPQQLNYFAEQRQFNLRMQANGVNFDQYLKVQGQTVEEFRAWLHAEAERKLRSRMGLLLVAQKEGLWPTEAEVDDELAHWDAKRDGEHTFASNDRRRAAQRIASSRAASFILAHSTLTPPPAEATVLKAENR